MKSAEETVQMLDDHIVMTQAMSFSPYKKPFEGRILTLENKLRTTQVWLTETYGLISYSMTTLSEHFLDFKNAKCFKTAKLQNPDYR